MAIIYINKLAIQSTIGVYDWEKEAPQQLFLSLRLSLNITQAALNDDLSQTIDYDDLTKKTIRWSTTQSFELIETMAIYLLKKISTIPPIKTVQLTLRKPGALADANYVEITVNSEEDL